MKNPKILATVMALLFATPINMVFAARQGLPTPPVVSAEPVDTSIMGNLAVSPAQIGLLILAVVLIVGLFIYRSKK